MLGIIIIGIAVCSQAVYHLHVRELDTPFWLLSIITVTLAPHISVQMPGINGKITVSDTLIFLTMLLYGGDAAVLLAAAEGIPSMFGIARKPITFFFNSAVMACSTFLTVVALRYLFGTIRPLPHEAFSGNAITAICVMGLIQFLTNSVLGASAQGLKTGQSVWQVWRKYCLWASITYFAGASGAFLIARLVGLVGFYAILAVTPIIAIIYFTYRTYLKNIEVMAAAAKAEAEAAARAEAAVTQAEQARRHVEELNHYIAEQERIREQYSQIEKLSALGELASGVAHDFNNTLTGILGRAQLLLLMKEPEKIEHGLRLIIKTAKDGARTVRRIQDFARQRRDQDFAPLCVDQLLTDIREITRPRWKTSAEAAGIQINLNLEIHSHAFVMGDESELREVLVNLVFNAVDAMSDGGTLTLSTRETDSTVEISVSDTGTGMSDEVRGRIFDPFYTTKGKAGMGLGLAVSYGIIRRHEGTIEVESETGRGSLFRIRLPKFHGEAGATAVGEASASLVATSSAVRTKFLVVDDEEDVRLLLRDILERAGYEVTLAQEGREALALFEQKKFDAVFTDLGLPGMSGWQLAHSIREQNRKIHIAIITGWGQAVGSSAQREAEVDWVVSKPFDIERILEIAREISLRTSPPHSGAGHNPSSRAAA